MLWFKNGGFSVVHSKELINMHSKEKTNLEEVGIPDLKLIFDASARETISDEQVHRVLEPIRLKINADGVRAVRPRLLPRLTATLAPVAAALVIVVAASIMQLRANPAITEIHKQNPPLAGTISENGIGYEDRIRDAEQGITVETQMPNAETALWLVIAIAAGTATFTIAITLKAIAEHKGTVLLCSEEQKGNRTERP